MLARRRASEVLDLGDGRVLRRGGAPAREAALMEHVRGHGYPVPEVPPRVRRRGVLRALPAAVAYRLADPNLLPYERACRAARAARAL